MRPSLISSALLLCLGAFATACMTENGDAGNEAGRFDDVVEGTPNGAPAEGDQADPPKNEPAAPEATDGPGSPEEPPPPEAPERTCREPRDLGAISGDKGTPSVTAQGSCDDWIRVRVTEDWAGPTAGAMKVTATLISPESENFDLYAYVNTEADLLECTTVHSKSELPSGRSDILKLQWGEQYTANNSVDARTVSFQVKNKAGGCAKQSWTLLVQGNY